MFLYLAHAMSSLKFGHLFWGRSSLKLLGELLGMTYLHPKYLLKSRLAVLLVWVKT